MSNKFVEFSWEGEDEVLARMEAYELGKKERVKSLLDNLADFGVHVLQANVPVDTTYLLRHVDRTDVQWAPGGAGGGGSYQVTFGVKAGTSRHPLYVEFGTGLYGTVGWYIVPQHSLYMVFWSSLYKRRIRVRKTRGQHAQHYLYRTWREFQIYAMGRIMATQL